MATSSLIWSRTLAKFLSKAILFCSTQSRRRRSWSHLWLKPFCQVMVIYARQVYLEQAGPIRVGYFPQGCTKIFLVDMMFEVLSAMTSAKRINSVLPLTDLRTMNGTRNLRELKNVLQKVSSAKRSKILTRAVRWTSRTPCELRLQTLYISGTRPFRQTMYLIEKAAASKLTNFSACITTRMFCGPIRRVSVFWIVGSLPTPLFLLCLFHPLTR